MLYTRRKQGVPAGIRDSQYIFQENRERGSFGRGGGGGGVLYLLGGYKLSIYSAWRVICLAQLIKRDMGL